MSRELNSTTNDEDEFDASGDKIFAALGVLKTISTLAYSLESSKEVFLLSLSNYQLKPGQF